MIRLNFKNWQLTVEESHGNRKDNETIALLLTGNMPAGWAWTAAIRHRYDKNFIVLNRVAEGYRHVFRGEEIPFEGEYEVQIMGSLGTKSRTTNIVRIKIGDAIDGDADWPEIPTLFTDVVRDAANAMAGAELARDEAIQYAAAAEEAAEAVGNEAELAEFARQNAESAKNAAELAKSEAVTAKEQAQTAANNAQAARENAGNAQQLAEEARDSAAASAEAAEESARLAAEAAANTGASPGGGNSTEAIPMGYVTPEQYGAVGDGEHDDAPALKAALESGKAVQLTQDLYLKSEVLIIDHSVELEGNNHTLYSFGAILWFRAAIKESGECAIVHELPRQRHSRGYFLYKGRKAVNEDYEEKSYDWFDIYSVKLRNFRMICTGMRLKSGIYLQRVCDSEVDNVSVINIDGFMGEGECAFNINACNIKFTRCHAEGWAKYETFDISDCGYGYGVYGDNVIISNCTARNNKHSVMVGGFDCWVSNTVIEGCNFYVVSDPTERPNNGGGTVYREAINTHPRAINIVISNCNIVLENLDGVNKTGFPVIYFRNPVAYVNNVSINANPGVGAICFGEEADRIFFTNLHAPTCVLRTETWDGPLVYPKEVHLTSSVINRIEHSLSPTKIFLENCTIRERVDGSQYLYANNCYFAREYEWASKPTLTVYGETVLSNCIINGAQDRTVSKRSVVIKAPNNALHLIHSKIIKRIGNEGEYPITDAEDYEMHECRIEDALANQLDIKAELDYNTLH